MRVLLTDRFCDRAKTQNGQDDYFDKRVSGLALRVGHSTKSWTLHYSRNGKRIRLTFGTYPSLTLAAARSKALEAKAEIEAGHDPRSTQQDTLKAICEEYLHRESALRSTPWRRQQLERLVYPQLGDRPIGEIKRSEIVRFLDQIEDGSGSVMADRTLGIIRRVMNWHSSRSDDFRSPIVRGMERSKSQSRSRILTDEELRKVWTAGPFVRFILLTGARRSEAQGMTWTEINGNGDWTLPAARNKTKVDLVRPLSKAALSMLKEGMAPAPTGSDGEGNVLADGQNYLFLKFKAEANLPDVTLHDLRRTSRSLMSRARINSDVAERCLGHVIGGVRGIYDRHEYHREKAHAFEALASLIARIVEGKAEVVPIRGRSR
jgi:integrase